MTKRVQVTSPESGLTYTTVRRIGGTDIFTLYECSLPRDGPSDVDGNKYCILKIASEPVHNGALDKEAFVLKKMFDEALRLEEAWIAENPGTKVRMNYQFMFPTLIETFVAKDQEGRRVLILSLGSIANKLSDLAPLSHLGSEEGVRIDQRTSAWIMGKLLKALILAHSVGITNGDVCRDNILINREEHFVGLFDWSKAATVDEVDQESGAREIAQLAQAITRALGGDLRKGTLPSDKESSDEYAQLIRRFSLGKEGDAKTAHRDFYDLVHRLWPREFYPFTAHPLG